MLRQLADLRGQALIDTMLHLVRERRPIHLSIVGGEPLVSARLAECDRGEDQARPAGEQRHSAKRGDCAECGRPGDREDVEAT